MHPDQHAIVFDPENPAIAFVGSDGGVVRVDLEHRPTTPSQCAQRRYDYGSGPQPLEPADLERLPDACWRHPEPHRTR